MKKLLLVLSLVAWVNPAYSTVIKSNITGADMAGINVTAYFAGGGSGTVDLLTKRVMLAAQLAQDGR